MPLPIHLTREALGYCLHTNRELGMMLRREKPLAVFSEVDSKFVEPLRRYMRLFDRHVESGEFVKREHIEPIDIGPGRSRHHVHVILYALAEEAWRVDAMLELRRKLHVWTAMEEREEGRLLGYTELQNDAWIAKRFGKNRKHV